MAARRCQITAKGLKRAAQRGRFDAAAATDQGIPNAPPGHVHRHRSRTFAGPALAAQTVLDPLTGRVVTTRRRATQVVARGGDADPARGSGYSGPHRQERWWSMRRSVACTSFSMAAGRSSMAWASVALASMGGHQDGDPQGRVAVVDPAGPDAAAPSGPAALHARRPENPMGARALYLAPRCTASMARTSPRRSGRRSPRLHPHAERGCDRFSTTA